MSGDDCALSPVGRALNFVPGADAVVAHFVVCGIAPSDVTDAAAPTPPAPTLLWRWSATEDPATSSSSSSSALPPQLLDFCFPQGCRAEVTWATGAENAAVRAALVDPQHETSDPFVFLISGERAEPLFGVCIARTELALLPPPVMLQGKGKASDSNETAAEEELPAALLEAPFPVTRRCYALLSRHALLPLLHELLSAVLAADFAASADVRRTLLLRLLSSGDSASASAASQETLKLGDAKAALDILRFAGSAALRVPSPGDVLQYRLPGSVATQQPRSFRCPVGPTPRDSAMNMLMEWSLVTLFECLSLESALLLSLLIFSPHRCSQHHPQTDVLRVLSAVLCERSVLFVCEDVSVLSSIALSTLAAVQPLAWQGIFIPLLPTTISDAIEAPVPYIIGVPSVDEGAVSLDHVIVVDVARDRLTNHGAILPALPDGRILHERLRALHQQVFSPLATRSARSMQDAALPVRESMQRGSVARVALAHSLSLRLSEYVSWIVGQVSRHYHQLLARAASTANPKVGLAALAKSFTTTAQSSNKPFVQAFLSTQQFSTYFHRHILEKKQQHHH